MKRLILLVFGLCASAFPDVEVDEWILPVRIHYSDKSSKVAWIEYAPYSFYSRNPEDKEKRPIPGKRVLYLNKLDGGNFLTVSDSLYRLPDGFQCLIAKHIGLAKVDLIEDASSDSLVPIALWSSRWVDSATGRLLLENKPVFTDLIVTESEAAYNAEHVYCYDSTFTKARIRKLYKARGRKNPILKKAIAEHRIVFLYEVTP